MAEINLKDDLLNKLRAYTSNPDDENILYKELIKKTLLSSPELLYALNEKDLETELFDDNGNINWDIKTHEPLGEWDRYFGSNANIRPFLFIPNAQLDTKHYICYQVGFSELPRYNDTEKYTNITFNIFVHGQDRIDVLTGIPRHDLIASIIREKFDRSNIFGRNAKLISSKESITDNNYVVRTLVFEIVDLNGLCRTPYKGSPMISNYEVRR